MTRLALWVLLSAVAGGLCLVPGSAKAAGPNTVHASFGINELEATLIGLGLPHEKVPLSGGGSFFMVQIPETSVYFASGVGGCGPGQTGCRVLFSFLVDPGAPASLDFLNRFNSQIVLGRVHNNQDGKTSLICDHLIAGGVVQANIDIHFVVFLNVLADYLSARQGGPTASLALPDGQKVLMLKEDPRAFFAAPAALMNDLAALPQSADERAAYVQAASTLRSAYE